MMTLAELVDINSLTGWIGVPAVAWKSNLDSLGTDSARRLDGSPQRAKKNRLLANALLVLVRSRVLYAKCPKRRRFLEFEDLTRASAVERKHGCESNLEMKIMI
jgi:hypothetical protein